MLSEASGLGSGIPRGAQDDRQRLKAARARESWTTSSAKSLVIVESACQGENHHKYLGSGYTVKASMGHVMTCPRGPGRGLEEELRATTS